MCNLPLGSLLIATGKLLAREGKRALFIPPEGISYFSIFSLTFPIQIIQVSQLDSLRLLHKRCGYFPTQILLFYDRKTESGYSPRDASYLFFHQGHLLMPTNHWDTPSLSESININGCVAQALRATLSLL